MGENYKLRLAADFEVGFVILSVILKICLCLNGIRL